VVDLPLPLRGLTVLVRAGMTRTKAMDNQIPTWKVLTIKKSHLLIKIGSLGMPTVKIGGLTTPGPIVAMAMTMLLLATAMTARARPISIWMRKTANLLALVVLMSLVEILELSQKANLGLATVMATALQRADRLLAAKVRKVMATLEHLEMAPATLRNSQRATSR